MPGLNSMTTQSNAQFNTESLRNLLRDNFVVVAISLLVLVTIIVEPKFLSLANATNIMRQFGPLIMVALGMTFVIIGGFIDLSVSGIISLSAVVTLALINHVGQWAALGFGLSLGLLCGLLNSFLILASGAVTQAEGLFITFGMSVVYSGTALIFTGGATSHMSYIERNYQLFSAIGNGTLGVFSISFLIFLCILAVLYVFQRKTFIGRSICLTGGNKTAAYLAGIPVKKSIMVVYAVSGLMSSLGAIVLFARVTTASPVIGQGYDLNAIMAVVVGGTSLTGGKGSVINTVLGTLLVILLSNCMNMLGVSVYMQNILKGVILMTVIWLDGKKGQ